MENYQKNVVEDSNKSVRSEPTTSRITFEYTFPTGGGGGGVESMDDDSTTSSNKSTPYYTPLEFFQNSFEFPSPVLDKTHTFSPKRMTNDDGATDIATAMDTAAASIETSTTRRAPKASSPGGAFKQQLQQSQQSPALSRKMRRFSLYERRSCSPQHMLMRDVSGSVAETHGDKENTKPRHCDKPDDPPTSYLLASSGNNSPKLAATGLIDESSSPKILTVANDSGGLSGNSNSSRLIYSPKLLASISNLNLSGSPLSLINSASYKNGNYFKFPEIDQIVQSESVATAGSNGDGSTESSSDATVVAVTGATITTTTSTSSSNTDNQTLSQSIVPVKVDPKSDMKKNRKNKNNLTIKIRDPPAMKGGSTPSPSPKLKTPTIKNTKEKALSLDSAAVESEPKKVTFGASCDEIDSNAQNSAALLQLRQRRAMTADKHHHQYGGEQSTNLHSTSLSHLTTLTDFHGGATPAVFVSKPGSGSGGGGGITRTPRRRVMAGSSSNDWLQYHRKQNPYNLNVDSAKRSASDTDSSEKSFFDGDVVVLHEDDEVQCEEAETQFIQIPTVVSAAASTAATPRNIFKHNPLLHSSSTNLKTLPEFLTLVEFNAGTGSSSSSTEHRSPYKQKSMELPVTAQQPCMMNTPAILHTKHVGTSNSSTNLLQRRGSNHSLTLNLHGSCSNLLGSCRSGLSVSNYSLGSVGNSTTNLNVTQSSIVPTTVTQATLSTQNAKQSLFRRRGSNHSLTLTNLTATSCGNLNAFASQNCLNIENSGVTRTTSFITPTNNTASSTNPSFITKKGLLERRGSNQSLTLNMNSSLAVSSGNIHDTLVVDRQQQKLDPNCCSHANQRKFFSSENLNKSNAPFGDLNQTHKRNANQVCFGSVSDLKPRDMGPQVHGTASPAAGKRDSSEFPESTVCTCTGVRNIMTRPLSPQATSEEFKIYLAGIQMLQNASNPLNQEELIKLNFIFDNSYATNKNLIDQPLPSVLNMHSSRDVESPLGITYTSDDFEVVKKYEEAVHDILHHVRPSEDEQKRMFRDLHKEFWDLPLNHQEKPMVFGSQTKNRYKTILPNENSRFILAKEDQSCDLTKQLDENNVIISTMDKHNGSSSILDEQPYINANYIKGPDYASKCYVATQGPLPNTIFEFWLMVYQNTKRFLHETNDANAGQCYGNLKQYYQKIVMLTNFLENNRQKCSVYFPVELHEIFAIIKHQESWHLSDLAKNYFNEFLMATEDREFALNDEQIKIECITTTLSEELARELPVSGSFFVLKNVGIVRKNGFSIRKLVMLYCMQFSEISSNAVRQQKLCINRLICYHYWYPDWPDHRSPRDINALLDICLHILNLGKCESEFENFNLTDESLKAHLMAQKIDAYQQDLFNAVQPLPVIHCSAGIGRTGCLTAILNAIRQLRQSLSYSLTTMAQELRLKLLQEPAMDLEIADSHWNLINLCNDTDSSFTRNTLFYILHIVHGQQLQEKDGGGLIMNTNKRKHEEVVVVGGGDQGDDQETTRAISVRQLPKLPDIFVDCLGIVCNLRLQRGGMVQNSEQYELIHRAICLYMKRTFALKRF